MNQAANTPHRYTETLCPVTATWAALKEDVMANGKGWSPLAALQDAQSTPWVVDGVIPESSIVWAIGAPASGKTFSLIDLACCVASGRPWHTHQCEPATVLYVAAEGGSDIHIRRAAAELTAGEASPFFTIEQTRPQIGEEEGLLELMSLVQTATADAIRFESVDRITNELWEDNGFKKYLKPDELKKFDDLDRYKDLDDLGRELLSESQVAELDALEKNLKPYGLDTDELSNWGLSLAEGRLPPKAMAAYKYQGRVYPPKGAPRKKVLLIIDTFSQTAPDDTKVAVSRYIKHLRDLIEEAAKSGGSISIIVADHLTKSGDSFMGAMAKLGDSDAMIEFERKGQLVTVTCPDKMRSAKPFNPIHLELADYALKDYPDTQGRPLTSLVVRDGEKIYRARKAAGTSDETAASIVTQLLTEQSDSSSALEDLRQQFLRHPTNQGKKTETVKRAFLRAIESLTDDEIVAREDDTICLSHACLADLV